MLNGYEDIDINYNLQTEIW